ncbi:MAG: hypothetical protein IIY39_03085, partial [Firmicutes bacterium]|nr:hypothetical protein [Bacillota bacterium]
PSHLARATFMPILCRLTHLYCLCFVLVLQCRHNKNSIYPESGGNHTLSEEKKKRRDDNKKKDKKKKKSGKELLAEEEEEKKRKEEEERVNKNVEKQAYEIRGYDSLKKEFI